MGKIKQTIGLYDEKKDAVDTRDLAEVLNRGPGAVMHGPVLDTADIYEMLVVKGVKPDLEIRDPEPKEEAGGEPQEGREPVPAIAPPLIMELKTSAIPEAIVKEDEQDEDCGLIRSSMATAEAMGWTFGAGYDKLIG